MHLTPDLLARVGAALCGSRWQTELAEQIVVSDRTMRRWLAGDYPIPSGIATDLARMCLERAQDLDDLAAELKQVPP